MMKIGKIYKYKFNARWLPSEAILWPDPSKLNNLDVRFSVPPVNQIYKSFLFLIDVKSKKKINNRRRVVKYFKLRFLIESKIYVTGWIYEESLPIWYKEVI